MTAVTEIYDFVVIGAGIAGTSVAAELAERGAVLILEMEAQPGFHTTGRSAAMFAMTYGPAPIRALTRASKAFFEQPPRDFTDHGLLMPRGMMMVAREDQMIALDQLMAELDDDVPGLRQLDGTQARSRMPLLRDGYVTGALFDEHSRDIDVHALHQGFLRYFRASGGTLATSEEALALERDGGVWCIKTKHGVRKGSVIVNAAGAWADRLGALAGSSGIGLMPKRRTAMTVAAPAGIDMDDWPMTVDVEERFYLKPESGRLLISPADETPSEPCDAQPDEMDVAVCADRIQNAFDVEIRRIENKWAGLRSFVSDKCPVCGYDPQVEGLFWLAGQGGYGIQSAPALAKLAASLILASPLEPSVADQGVDPAALAPDRPALAPPPAQSSSHLVF